MASKDKLAGLKKLSQKSIRKDKETVPVKSETE